jgi:hypothetical protein
MRRVLSVVVVCWLLLATVAGPAAAAGRGDAATATASAALAAAADGSEARLGQPASGVVRHTVRLDGAGTVSVDLAVGLTEPTAEFRVSLPRGAEVTATEGFERVEPGRYEWDGRTEAPSLTYRAAVNETVGDSVRFAATADWALVDLTDLDAAYSWRSFGTTDYERRFAAPEGHTGASMAYLGAQRVASATGAGQRFTVVHPAAASTNLSAATYAGTLAAVADDLRVGGRAPTVTAFIAPPPVGSEGGEGGTGGLSAGADLWVAAGAATTTDANGTRVAEPIFIHEYVHTRQNYSLADDMTWFTEASAFYYMVLTPYQRGAITRSAFERRFRVPDSRRDAVLTGTTAAQYRTWARKGPRTLATLDRRVRMATNGSRTLQDVFRRVNDREGNVTYAEFRAVVGEVAGTSQADWLDRHVDGPELAPRPDPDAYPGPGLAVDPAAAEWRRGDRWVPLSSEPLPAGIEVRVRHPDAGVVVRPAGAGQAVNVTGGDPATVRLPTGEARLRVETFYGRNATTVAVATSDDVDGDGVTNAAELEQGSDPYDAASSTATPEPGLLGEGGEGGEGDGATTGDGGASGDGPVSGDGPGFGAAGALVALVVVTVAGLHQRR